MDYNILNVVAPAWLAAVKKPSEMAMRWAMEEVDTKTKTDRAMVWFHGDSEIETTSDTSPHV